VAAFSWKAGWRMNERAAFWRGFHSAAGLIPGLGAIWLALSLGLAAAGAAVPDGAKAFKVRFAPPAGVYTNEVAVKLGAATPGATIHYTLDGSAPTTNSPVYAAPVAVTQSRLIRARAFVGAQPAGLVEAAAYTILEASLFDFSSNLPLLVLNTYGGPVEEDEKRPAYLAVIEPAGGRARLSGPLALFTRIGLEWRGSSSMRFPKKSMALECQDETTMDDRKVPLLGLPADSDWVLYGPFSDKTLMRNALNYDLWEAMGHYSVRRRLVEVFLDMDGERLEPSEYAGVYLLLEKIKQGKHRVNIAKLNREHTAEPEISGGYILKRDRLDANDNPIYTGIGPLGIEYPKAANLASAQKSWLTAWFREFESALAGPQFADPQNGYARYVDVPSFIDYYWMVEMPKCIDGYTFSVFMHKDRGGKLCLSPIWDRNLSFGNANYQRGDSPEGWLYQQCRGRDLWYERLFTDPDFYQRHVDRWAELRQGLFAMSNLLARVDAYAALLEEAQVREFQRWPRLGVHVWPNASEDARQKTYAGTVGYLKNFLTNRLDWIDRQFPRVPQFNRPGGRVSPGFTLTMSGPTNAIYFTVNGPDPRQAGGQPDPKAHLYSGPVKLHAYSRVFARARAGNRWSAPAVEVFIVKDR